jgi:hypothetical protein
LNINYLEIWRLAAGPGQAGHPGIHQISGSPVSQHNNFSSCQILCVHSNTRYNRESDNLDILLTILISKHV